MVYIFLIILVLDFLTIIFLKYEEKVKLENTKNAKTL